MNDTEFRESLEALSSFFVGDAPLDNTVQKVTELARDAVEPAATVGLTMLVNNKPATAFYTDSSAPEIDQRQYEQDHGPCLDAFRTKTVVRVESTDAEPRYPVFAEDAAKHGISSTLSLPLVANERPLGALNFYAKEPAAFDENAERRGQVFADQAAMVLANSQAYWDLHDLHQSLEQAMQHRAVIEQAKGVLMAQSNVDADAAFDILRRISQRENRKLRDVAHELVERVATRSATDPR